MAFQYPMNGKRFIPGLLCISVAALLLQQPRDAVAAEGQPESHEPGIELPEGEGRALLLTACVRCHDLRGLPAYKGYWNSERWRGMIEAMVKNGAPLNPGQTAVLADYLAQHFGQSAAAPE